MKEWETIVACVLAVLLILYAIQRIGQILAASLDELHAKVDALTEKVDELQSDIETRTIDRTYVNPIDIDHQV